eukprot:7209031-Prymnesium_polylepis.2
MPCEVVSGPVISRPVRCTASARGVGCSNTSVGDRRVLPRACCRCAESMMAMTEFRPACISGESAFSWSLIRASDRLG